MEIKRFDSTEGDMWKYIFHLDSGAIAEAVLYRYGTFLDRTVIRVSCQSGCEVGCMYCSAGKKFIRNLTEEEIIYQVNYLVNEAEDLENDASTVIATDCNNFQIMFMGMGEPMLNWDNVEASILKLNTRYPYAEILISTIGIQDDDVLNKIIRISRAIPAVSLQLSIQDAFDEERNSFIPYENKLSVRNIRNFGTLWNNNTGNLVHLDYTVSKHSISEEKLTRLMDLFDPHNFHFNFSASHENKDSGIEDGSKDDVEYVSILFIANGYEVSNMGPTEKDDARGAGHHWYVQDWLKDKVNLQ